MKQHSRRWWTSAAGLLLVLLLVLLMLGAAAAGVGGGVSVSVGKLWQPWQPAHPSAAGLAPAFGLPALQRVADAVRDPARIELGRKLFFDRRLSFNGSLSCAMCHVPEEGFTSQASRLSVGMEGKSLKRNAPTLLNVAWQAHLFHDGRERDLADQAWLPLLHTDELANPSIGFVLQRLGGLPDYAGQFERVFKGHGPSMQTVGAALAAFEASLVAANSRFDRWRYGRDRTALDATEQRGLALFTGAARCSTCHLIGEQHAVLSDGQFHVTGVGLGPPSAAGFSVVLAAGVQTVLTDADVAAFTASSSPDLGRYDITLNPADRYAFKTPTLRNVAHTPPYMHDGSLPTLAAVIEFYNQGGGPAPGKHPALAPLALSASDQHALVAFLGALDGADLPVLMNQSRPARMP